MILSIHCTNLPFLFLLQNFLQLPLPLFTSMQLHPSLIRPKATRLRLRDTHSKHFVLLTNSQLPTVQYQLGSSPTQTLGPYSAGSLLQGPEVLEPAGHVPLLRVLLSALCAPSSKLPRRCRCKASQAAALPRGLCSSSAGPLLQASRC